MSRRGHSTALLTALLAVLITALGMFASARASEPAATKTWRVLFVGNSLTYVNNLPAVVRALAAAQPSPVRIETQTFVAPGGSLAERWKDGAAAKALGEGHWDALVLQERGGLLACMVDPDSRPGTECRASDRAHREFAARAKAAGARTLLIATWGPDEGWQSKLDRAAKQVASRIDAQVLPAGPTLQHYAAAHGRKDTFPDGLHPSLSATVIMAAQVYRAVVGRDAQAADVTIDFPLLPPRLTINPSMSVESQPHLMRDGKHMVLAASAIAPLLAEAKP